MPTGVYERRPDMQTFGKTRNCRQEIIARHNNGESYRQIAKAYDVEHSTIYKIVKGDWNAQRRKA